MWSRGDGQRRTPRPPTYIRDIHLPDWQQICRILDASHSWISLAALLGFSNDDVQIFKQALQRPASSPTGDMLTRWDYGNHTITELFRKLYELRNARCMMLLKDYVDASLHNLIEEIQGIQPTDDNDSSASVYAGHPHLPRVNYAQGGQQPYSGDAIRQPTHQSQHSSKLQATQGSWNCAEQQIASLTGQNQQAQHNRRSDGLTANINKASSEKVIGLGSPFKGWGGETGSSGSVDNKSGMRGSMTYGGSMGIASAQEMGEKEKLENYQNQSALGLLIHFEYGLIIKATNDFNDAFKLGEGSFGTVYHAVIKMSHYAVKRMKQNEHMGFETDKIARADQMKELRALVTYRNANIVSLYAYCFDGPSPCLVYEFMENGSLEDNLLRRGQRGPLDWKTRHKIAGGSALGINFLHNAQDQPLIHGDIKSANILLGKHFEPKIADFGLARLGPENGKTYCYLKTKNAHGTLPYLPEEFKRSFQLSTKVDVYSFGVVLMEILAGERVADSRREPNKLLTDMVEETLQIEKPQGAIEKIRDRRCPDWPWDIAWYLLELAVECTASKFTQRPKIEEAVKQLRNITAEIVRREQMQKQDFPVLDSFRRSPECLPNTPPQGYTSGGYNGVMRYPADTPGLRQDSRYEGDSLSQQGQYRFPAGIQGYSPGFESGARKHTISEVSSEDNTLVGEYKTQDLPSSSLMSSCDMSFHIANPSQMHPGQSTVPSSVQTPSHHNLYNTPVCDPRLPYPSGQYPTGYPGPTPHQTPQGYSQYQNPSLGRNSSPQPHMDFMYQRTDASVYPVQSPVVSAGAAGKQQPQQRQPRLTMEDHMKQLDISQLPTKPMGNPLNQNVADTGSQQHHLKEPSSTSRREPEQNTDIIPHPGMKDRSPMMPLVTTISEESDEEGSALNLSLTTTQMRQFLPENRVPTQQTEKLHGTMTTGKQADVNSSPAGDKVGESKRQSSLTTVQMKRFLSSKREPTEQTECLPGEATDCNHSKAGSSAVHHDDSSSQVILPVAQATVMDISSDDHQNEKSTLPLTETQQSSSTRHEQGEISTGKPTASNHIRKTPSEEFDESETCYSAPPNMAAIKLQQGEVCSGRQPQQMTEPLGNGH